MLQEDIYIERCREACRDILTLCIDVPVYSLIVYGSLARGTLGMSSDIDIMVVLDADGKQVPQYREQFARKCPAYFLEDKPYVDVRFCRRAAYENPDDSEFGVFMQNCKKDGVCVWSRI